MAEYIANVSAISNGTPNTYDEFVELKANTGTTIQLKRARVSFVTTTPGDNECSIKILRNSAAGSFTSGTAFTPLKMRTTAPAATATCTVKNGSNAATLGANTDTPIFSGVNTRSVYEWIAADQTEWIESGTSAYIAIAIASSAASQSVNVECVWEE